MDDLAFEMFKLVNSGYCCTQVIVKMALNLEEKENEDLIRAVNGLCMGVGSEQKECGVLSGAIITLGLYGGKGSDMEYPNPCFSDMIDEFKEWFESEFGSTECRDIIGVCSVTEYNTNQQYRMKCGDTLIKSFQKIQEILHKNDFEFGSRE